MIVAGLHFRVWINRALPDLNPNVLLSRLLDRGHNFLLNHYNGEYNRFCNLSRHWSCLVDIRLWLLVTIVNVFLSTKLVKDRFTIIQKILIACCEPLYDLSKDSSTVRLDQTGYDLVSYVLCWSPQHLLKLCCREALNDYILLFIFKIVFPLKVNLPHWCERGMCRWFLPIALSSLGIQSLSDMLWILLLV